MMTSISSINTNAPAMQYQSQLNRSIDKQNTSMERLSSGLKINSAKDDAAGLQISNRLQSQSRGMDVAIRNANDGISMLQTAEGALGEYTENLMRMRDLTLRYANDSLISEDREAIREEFKSLRGELNRITQTTSFAGDKLLNGSNSSRSFQLGSNSGEAIKVNLPKLNNLNESGSTSKSTVIETYHWLNNSYSGDRWRSLPGDKLSFLIRNNNGKAEELSIKPDPGTSLPELLDDFNSQFGDKMKVYIEYVEVVSPRNPDSKYIREHLNFYALDGTSSMIVLDGRTANDSRSILGPVYGYRYKDIKDENKTILPSLSQDTNPDIVLKQLDDLIAFIDSERAYMGSTQNRFSHAINNLSQSSENVADSHSQIRDTDFAKESTQLTKQSILREVNTSMLAQASNAPRSALNLLS
ncbi:TPA: flagellin [Vibrio parahaemolyticus]